MGKSCERAKSSIFPKSSVNTMSGLQATSHSPDDFSTATALACDRPALVSWKMVVRPKRSLGSSPIDARNSVVPSVELLSTTIVSKRLRSNRCIDLRHSSI